MASHLPLTNKLKGGSNLVVDNARGARPSLPSDFRAYLSAWPYDPENNVRLVRDRLGPDVMLVRQPMGLEQYEIRGRPDGEQPHGMESALDFQLTRLTAVKQAKSEEDFSLSAEDCAELFYEGTLYYHRLLHLFRANEWTLADDDATQILGMIDLIEHYGQHEEDRLQPEQWRRGVTRIKAAGKIMVLLLEAHPREALKIVQETFQEMEDVAREFECGTPDPKKVVMAVLNADIRILGHPSTLHPRTESVFVERGDYWTIQYQGQVARLRSTRGMECLAYLLRNPGREFHVCELVNPLSGSPADEAGSSCRCCKEAAKELPIAAARDGSPILDARAKAEYAARMAELQEELQEARRFNDSARAVRIQSEICRFVDQLTAAVGLGGRDRRAGSQAERARSTVTKRLKDSIRKIARVIRPLGQHLAVRVKTGYFCSYTPHPDRPVKWRLSF